VALTLTNQRTVYTATTNQRTVYKVGHTRRRLAEYGHTLGNSMPPGLSGGTGWVSGRTELYNCKNIGKGTIPGLMMTLLGEPCPPMVDKRISDFSKDQYWQ